MTPEVVLLIERNPENRDGLEIRIDPAFEDPREWGALFADLVRRVAQIYMMVEQATTPIPYMERIKAAFDLEWETPDPDIVRSETPQVELFYHAPNATIPLSAQIASVKRELLMRGKVYPNWVDRGRMGEEQAAYEMAAMGAVLKTLERLKHENPDL